jgi:hypothetical protein
MKAADALDYRAMLLVYLELPVAASPSSTRTTSPAPTFPSHGCRSRRSTRRAPSPRTPRCCALNCRAHPAMRTGTPATTSSARLVVADLERSGLPLPAQPRAVHVRRLRHAYPIYTRGYAEPFAALDRWAAACRTCSPSGGRAVRARQHAPRAGHGVRGRGLFEPRWVRHREVGPLPAGVRQARRGGLRIRPSSSTGSSSRDAHRSILRYCTSSRRWSASVTGSVPIVVPGAKARGSARNASSASSLQRPPRARKPGE